MLCLIPYNRRAAVRYAHRWAFGRNPRYYDYENIGGDCTNFASQCLFAGTGVMNYTPTFGWYYIDANNKAPAWTGVEYFYNFLIRAEQSVGPFGVDAQPEQLLPGDFVQIKRDGDVFTHTPVIVAIDGAPTPDNILVAAHSYNTDFRPLSAYYDVKEYRFIHIVGARVWC